MTEKITIVEGNRSQFVKVINDMLKKGDYFAHWETFSAWTIDGDNESYCRIVMEKKK